MPAPLKRIQCHTDSDPWAHFRKEGLGSEQGLCTEDTCPPRAMNTLSPATLAIGFDFLPPVPSDQSW